MSEGGVNPKKQKQALGAHGDLRALGGAESELGQLWDCSGYKPINSSLGEQQRSHLESGIPTEEYIHCAKLHFTISFLCYLFLR